MDGIINVYKEKDFTSFDVVAKLRGILKQRKIGHTGTLDPDAVGVLPVCVGKATALCEFLTDKDKEYEAVMHLGIVTDTLDMTGNVLKTSEVNVTSDMIKEVVGSFVGDIMQVPPMYSAIKIKGKKLYEIARAGGEVDRPARQVHISSIDILEINPTDNTVRIRTTVSKGTYIRSLCDDIGRSLGCGACMGELVRLRSGVFGIENALTLDQINELAASGELANSDNVISIEEVFNLPCKCISMDNAKKVLNGNPVTADMLQDYNREPSRYGFLRTGNQDICLYLEEGTFIAIYRYNEETDMYKPLKMFMSLNEYNAEHNEDGE